MKVFVSIQNFGDIQQKLDLCDGIANATFGEFAANIAESGNVLITCEVIELGLLLGYLSDNAATNWVEYTIQFDA